MFHFSTLDVSRSSVWLSFKEYVIILFRRLDRDGFPKVNVENFLEHYLLPVRCTSCHAVNGLGTLKAIYCVRVAANE